MSRLMIMREDGVTLLETKGLKSPNRNAKAAFRRNELMLMPSWPEYVDVIDLVEGLQLLERLERLQRDVDRRIPQPDVAHRRGVLLQRGRVELVVVREVLHRDLVQVHRRFGSGDVALDVRPLFGRLGR